MLPFLSAKEKEGRYHTKTIKITYPDYVPGFCCKCGACRTTCCRGWKVTLSQSEYFRVAALRSAALHRRLTEALVEDDGAHEEGIFAHLAKTPSGDCTLLDRDGLCALHRAGGAEALPAICRLYPRAVRMGSGAEISCSTGCEKTVEMLCATTAPLGFETIERSVSSPLPEVYYDAAERDRLRQTVIAALSDRSRPLLDRLGALKPLLPSPGTALPCDDTTMLLIAQRFIRRFEGSSPSIALYGATADRLFGREDGKEGPIERFLVGERLVYELMPDYDVRCEKLLVNHVFYEQFPYPFEDRGALAGGETLFAAASLLRVATVGAVCHAAAHGEDIETAFADAAAGCFRFLEHTDFYRNAAILLLRCGDLYAGT